MNRPQPQSRPLASPLKWTGGKAWHAPVLAAVLPSIVQRVVDPFCGSLAIPLAIAALVPASINVVASDASIPLINLWRCLQQAPMSVAIQLDSLPKDGEDWASSYDALRAQFNMHRQMHGRLARDRSNPQLQAAVDRLDPFRFAALMIWINRSCFNGLQRENSSGDFNVPVGRTASNARNIPSAAELFTFGRSIRSWEIERKDFRQAVDDANLGPGDLLVLDPPYESTHQAYTEGGFQDSLRAVAAAARGAIDAGAHVVVYNSDNPEVRGAFQSATNWCVESIPRARTNGPTGSAVARELVLSTFPLKLAPKRYS